MSDRVLDAIRGIIQVDINNRGLAADPRKNLFTACRGDFAAACRSIAESGRPALGIVTGFYIPTGYPPCSETDGPLGALFLARALTPLGIKVVLATEGSCLPALAAGLRECGLRGAVPLIDLPPGEVGPMEYRPDPLDYWKAFATFAGPLTHLIALERPGPSNCPLSLAYKKETTRADIKRFIREVPAEHHDRCHTMRGHDITAHMARDYLLFVAPGEWNIALTTIGIGDGGNEIGMGKLPWPLIRDNVPSGQMVACWLGTDYLLVCGISNWGAYGLAAGVLHLRGVKPPPDLFDIERERELLRRMVERGPLVDGVTGRQAATVDGLSFERYAAVLPKLHRLLSTS